MTGRAPTIKVIAPGVSYFIAVICVIAQIAAFWWLTPVGIIRLASIQIPDGECDTIHVA